MIPNPRTTPRKDVTQGIRDAQTCHEVEDEYYVLNQRLRYESNFCVKADRNSMFRIDFSQ